MNDINLGQFLFGLACLMFGLALAGAIGRVIEWWGRRGKS